MASGVYDTDDYEPRVLNPIDDQVGLMWMTANGRTDLHPLSGDFGKLCEQVECPSKAADVAIRLIWAPALG